MTPKQQGISNMKAHRMSKAEQKTQTIGHLKKLAAKESALNKHKNKYGSYEDRFAAFSKFHKGK